MTQTTCFRRCSAVLIETREERSLDVAGILTGGNAVYRRQFTYALAAHLDDPVEVNGAEIDALSRFSSEVFESCEGVDGVGVEIAQQLHSKRLLIGPDDSDDAATRDARVRSSHWHPMSAVYHRHGRWRGIVTPDANPESNTRSLSGLVKALGLPPTTTVDRGDSTGRVQFPFHPATATSDLLRGRATCRNYDRSRPLPLSVAGALLHGVFGVQGAVEVAEGVEVIKKLSPSGGGLHPTEAYVVAIDIEGLTPGIWHYRPRDGALDPLELSNKDDLREFALKAVAGQEWFMDAPMLVIHACRFARSFWKYRSHLKAYRAILVDIGHLSQTAYLMATELGLGAFVTVAINEADIEQRLGLDPMVEGPLAISGFGYRSATAVNPEFDPQRMVWKSH